MYISSNDLKIYNLILVVFSSIDDSFSCVMADSVWGIFGDSGDLSPLSFGKYFDPIPMREGKFTPTK